MKSILAFRGAPLMAVALVSLFVGAVASYAYRPHRLAPIPTTYHPQKTTPPGWLGV